MKTCQHGACLLYQAELPRSAASFSALLVEHGNLSIHGSRHYGSWRLGATVEWRSLAATVPPGSAFVICTKKHIRWTYLSVIPWSLASIRITFLDSTFPFCRPSEILEPKPQTDPKHLHGQVTFTSRAPSKEGTSAPANRDPLAKSPVRNHAGHWWMKIKAPYFQWKGGKSRWSERQKLLNDSNMGTINQQ